MGFRVVEVRGEGQDGKGDRGVMTVNVKQHWIGVRLGLVAGVVGSRFTSVVGRLMDRQLILKFLNLNLKKDCWVLCSTDTIQSGFVNKFVGIITFLIVLVLSIVELETLKHARIV